MATLVTAADSPRRGFKGMCFWAQDQLQELAEQHLHDTFQRFSSTKKTVGAMFTLCPLADDPEGLLALRSHCQIFIPVFGDQYVVLNSYATHMHISREYSFVNEFSKVGIR